MNCHCKRVKKLNTKKNKERKKTYLNKQEIGNAKKETTAKSNYIALKIISSVWVVGSGGSK